MIVFDTIMLAGASRDLQNTVIGGRVERISQPAAHMTHWSIYVRSRKVGLVIETDAMSNRLHLSTRSRQSPATPPGFCMLLRKFLGGAWLEGIEHPHGFGERVVRLHFAGIDGQSYALYVELMGRHSNQIVVSEADNRILGAIKRVTPEMSRMREIRAGIEYTPPPRQRGAKRDVFSPTLGNDLPMRVFADEDAALAWALATFSGISPLMAAEGIARRPEGELTSENVWYGLNSLINYVRLADYAPVIVTDALGRISGAYPIALRTVPGSRQLVASTFSQAIDDAVEAIQERELLDAEKTAYAGALRRARHVLEKEAIDTAEGLANCERVDEYRTSGNLILASMAQIAPGSRSLVADDYETGEPLTVELDPKLGPHQNAERYFKKAKTAEGARAGLSERLAQIEERIAAIDEALPRIEAASSVEAVQAAVAGLESLRSAASGAEVERPGEQKVAEYPGYKIKILHSVDGWEILVGENAESNDYITTRLAKPSDIWLHARAQTSAHAIIRALNRPAAVSSAALRFAAEQVAKRSMAKHSRLVPVDYTLKKHVRKPRGAQPGTVTYSREKTLDVSPDAG